jgi:tetratricopeptide (TPR) repeat protein
VGHYPEALRRFHQALAAQGDARLDDIALSGLCAAFVAERRWDEATPTCERRLRSSRRVDPSVLYNVGAAYFARKRCDELRDVALTHRSLQPTRPQAHILLGMSAACVWRCGEALPHFERALQLSGGADQHIEAWIADMRRCGR